jgi:anti-anti-sigma factor
MMDDKITPAVDNIPALLKGLTAGGTTSDDKYHLTVTHDDGIVTLRVTGFLLQPIPIEFSTRFETLITTAGIRRVLIDLSGCTYMSSAVLAYLVKYFDLTADSGGTMVVVRPPPKVQHVLKAIGLDAFFTFVETEEEGRTALRAVA